MSKLLCEIFGYFKNNIKINETFEQKSQNLLLNFFAKAICL